MLLSSLLITSVSGLYSSLSPGLYSSLSDSSWTSSSGKPSDTSAYFFDSILEQRIPANILYHDRSSVWAKILFDNYKVNYPLSPDVNACSKSYSLPLNTTIRLQAVSSSDCTINIKTSLNSAIWLVIEIRRRDGNPNYSTFFVENISEEDSESAADIISLPLSDCKVKLLAKSLIFHLVMTYIDISIHTYRNANTTTLKQNPCGVEYNGVAWYHHKWYPFVKYDKFVIGLWNRQRIRIQASMFHLFCPRGCSCSLGHNQWLKNCQAAVHKVLLVCNPNIASLSFSKRRLNKIESRAFLCYVSLRKLILRKNRVQTLPKQTFEVLQKLTFLDVSYNRLMFLPNGIFDHQIELEYLKLNNNHLNSLPSNVFYFLNRLTYLELGFNLIQIAFESSMFSELQNLRDANIQLLSNNSFSFLINLENLNLRDNDISTLNSNIFSNLANLLHMNLGHNKLTRIGSDVFNFTFNLASLLLDHNHLAFLPGDVFKNLVRLKYLQLSNNLFTSGAGNILSEMSKPLAQNSFSSPMFLFRGQNKLSEIGINVYKLPKRLKRLSLDHNELSILHASMFSNLTKLQKLNLSHNRIYSLPEDIFAGLDSLRDLDLSYNFLAEFPKTILTLKFLRLTNNKASSIYLKRFRAEDSWYLESDILHNLDFSHNRINIIPSNAFTKYIFMIELNLAFNEITHVTKASFPSGIQDLKLNNNRLRTLPHDIFDGFVYLYDLSLNDNRLVALPDFSSVQSALVNLRLSNNRLTIYPDSLFSLRIVRLLKLQNNAFSNFQNISFQFNTIRYLDISGNKLFYLQNGLLDECLKLRVLLAGDNKIRELPSGIFDSLQIVFKLSLKFNNLTMLHDTLFHSMRSLQHLYLEGNNLVTLPMNIFTFNIKLKHLILSRNKFIVLHPDIFKTLSKLEVLELEGSEFRNVSIGYLDTLVSLQTLLMSGNHIIYLHESVYNVTTKLQFLDLCCNDISSLPMNIFTPLISLEYLDLSNNSLRQLPSLASCSKLIFLELSNNMLSHQSFYSCQRLSNLKMLTMQNNNISVIPRHALETLKILRVFILNSNFVTSLDAGTFKNLGSLQILQMSNNWISNIGNDSLIDLENLITLELQNNNVTFLSQSLFQNLTHLIFLNISQNHIQNVYLGGMTSNSLQLTVDLRGNMLRFLTARSFPNFEITFIVDHYAACCFMVGNVTCFSLNVRSDYLTCKQMLPSVMLRLTMWLVGLASVIFNIGVICSRLYVGMKSTLQSVLIMNLAVSDFLMGVDMLILSSADIYYGNFFPSFSASWIESSICKIAAVLSTLSSEASVILVTLIGFDRYLGVRYPLGGHTGLGKTRTRICVFMCWLVSMMISLIPVITDKYIPEFYDVSEVCVGLPIVKRRVTVEKDAFFPVKTFDIQPEYVFVRNNESASHFLFNSFSVGKYWRLESTSTVQDIYYHISVISGFRVANFLSITVFIGFNMTCFMALAVFYIRVFQIASGSSKAIQSTAKTQEIRMALKMSVVVLTDFLCWVPLALLCLFVQCGAFTVGPIFYSWTVGLILPINSCLNPFLYTLAVVLLNRQTKKRKSALDTQKRERSTLSTTPKFEQ